MANRNEGAPAMWLWVDRFFGSARVQQLDGMSQAVYLVLLAREWQFQGAGLPAKEAQLMRLTCLEEADWRRVWPDLEQFFERRKGRLFNRVLEAELESTIEIKKARSKAGKRGAERRWQGHDFANDVAIDLPSNLPMAKQCPPSPSPSLREEPPPSETSSRVRAREKRSREAQLARIRELRRKAREEDGLDRDWSNVGEVVDGVLTDEGRRSGAAGASREEEEV